jgi:hypothetical protein
MVFADSALGEWATDNYVPLNLPIAPNWVGQKIQLRFQGRDAQGNLSDFLTTPLDSIRVSASPGGP